MKKLFTLLMVCAVMAIASIPSIAGTGTAYFAGNSNNSDPEVVATVADRDAIPLAFRSERMYCYVADNHKVYQLRGGVTNAHWVELDIASSTKIQGPAGSLPYIDATGLLATDLRYLGKAKFDFSGANILGSGQYVTVNGIGNTVNDRSHNVINAYNSYSDGNYVLIMGERDSALGKGGAIIGSDITLRANHQFAAGRGLIGNTTGEVIFGQFNDPGNVVNNTWQNSDRLFSLGNGSGSGSRSNAMIVYKNGDAVFSGNLSAANMYTKLQIDSMFVVNGTGGGSGGVVQSLNLAGTSLTITGGNTVNFNGWDTDASDDFSGDYNDLLNTPALFSGDYNDLTNLPSFAGWDTDASDDFSGDYNDLLNTPALFSGNYNDLSNLPDFTGWDTDASDDFSGDFNDLVNLPNFSLWDQNAADDFSGDYNDLINTPALFSGDYNDLTNLPTFAGWDTDASDDFSGDYNDLLNTPALFSGNYNDLINRPDIYLKYQVDSAIAVGVSSGMIQNLGLNGTQLNISGGNSVNFLGWDTDASDDFSGDYNDLANLPKLFSGNYSDLTNKPTLFSGNYNDLNNKPSFNNWDQNVADDFSGDYMDLINSPDFTGWDTDASDDFSGDYNDLLNTPALFSGNYNDLTNLPDFTGWDTDASDDFSGNYNDLTNKPVLFNGDYNSLLNRPTFAGWDKNALDDFSGDYNDLTNLPDFADWDTDVSDDFSGDFNDLTNLPNFSLWDQNAADDFSGDYNDLLNQPALFSGNYNDLTNLPDFTGWDTDASDDFSGDYLDLTNRPSVYTRLQVDSLFVVNGSGSGSGTIQNLNLSGNLLTITGGNSVNFSGWDTDASDDFSGDYNDLLNTPALFSGNYNDLTNLPSFAGWDMDASDDFSGDYNDLINAPKVFDGLYSSLINAPTFAGWDTNAADDFSGSYADLTNIPADFQDGKINWTELDQKPILYTQLQVDSIRDVIIDSMKSYVDSAVISQDHNELISNRNLAKADIGKTLYTKASTTVLTIPAGLNMPFNAHVELRDFGSGTLILDASAVTIRDSFGNVISGTLSAIVIQDAAITVVGTDDYKIVGLYQ